MHAPMPGEIKLTSKLASWGCPEWGIRVYWTSNLAFACGMQLSFGLHSGAQVQKLIAPAVWIGLGLGQTLCVLDYAFGSAL